MKYYKLSLLNKSFSENIPYLESLFLFFIFTIFNFSWITGYLIILLIWAIIYKNTLLENKWEDFNLKYLKLKYLNINSNILKNILQVSFVLISIFWIYFYTNYYIQEHKLHEDNNYKSNNYLYNKIKQEDYEKNLWNESFINLEDMCKKKINYSNSVENYFYCWDLLWNNNEKLALEYYNSWLSKLPDLWNEDSKYNKQFLINNFVDKKRFFSDKYNNLIEILEKVWKNK
jgi:TM2 domain-containing membrane protein YozV